MPAENKVLSEAEISTMQAEIQKNLSEAEDTLAQAQALLNQADHLREQLDKVQGDLGTLMPKDRYAEEERVAFVGSMEMFIQEGGDWMVDYERKNSNKENNKPQKLPPKSRRHISL
ncbi:MAG TPA: hypothetical protein DIU37_05255 [Opitutae bacterium]|nr:hypothetical protein [Opitutae bacterium]|tara:strand:+ start:386 stop:733 length:348 start_codon:yes stop_codon:yes gene_type:complete